MQNVLEMTYFVGDSLNCPFDNLDALAYMMEIGLIDTGVAGAEPARFIEPSAEHTEALGASRYGLGFSSEFLQAHGLLEHMQTQSVSDDTQEAYCIWETPAPVFFSVEDIQTVYVEEPEAVMTLRMMFPRYAGTFVVF